MTRKKAARKRTTKPSVYSSTEQQKMIGIISIVLLVLLVVAVIFFKFSGTGQAILINETEVSSVTFELPDEGEEETHEVVRLPGRYDLTLFHLEDGVVRYAFGPLNGDPIYADSFTYVGEVSNLYLNDSSPVPTLQLSYQEDGIRVSEDIEEVDVEIFIPEPEDDGEGDGQEGDGQEGQEGQEGEGDGDGGEGDNETPEITMHLDWDEDLVFSNSFEVEISARNLEDKEYDVRVWVEDDDGVEISQRHDRSDGQFKSTRNFLRDLLDGPGSDDKTLRLRLLENYSNYVGEAELHFRMKDGDDFDEEIEDDIDFLEGAGERDRDITCAQEWDCGQFSACRNGVQTRSCTRSDNCNARIRAGQVDRVIPVSKPAERQSCAETENQFREEFDNTRVAPSDSSVAICSPNEKRCFGSQLQRCSFDGEEWQTIQTCPDQCDSFSLSCTEEDVSFSEPASKGLPDWLLPLVGVIVLLGIITALVVVMVQHKKKFGPAKQYVKSSRAKGLSDSTTRMRLISQGWDPDKVDKLMK